jgi:predicted amidophosphoribosyltransferase
MRSGRSALWTLPARAPAFDSTQAVFHYVKPVRQLISQFKFHSRLEIGASFEYLLAERFQHTFRRLPTSAPVAGAAAGMSQNWYLMEP